MTPLKNLFKLTLLISLCLMLTGCLERLFYSPDKLQYTTPMAMGYRFDWVNFRSVDGTSLTGWFIPAQGYKRAVEAKGTVIHFHGSDLNMSAHWEQVSWLPKRGYNVFVFDYRGYGQSEGMPNLRGIMKDSFSALEHIRSRDDINRNKLILFGQDIGGSNAIAVVGKDNHYGIAAIAVEAPIYSYADLADHKGWGLRYLMNDDYSASGDVPNLSPIPLLIMHGTADTKVPLEHSQRLFERAIEPKKLITIEGGTHLDAMSNKYGTKYQDELIKFFDQAVSSR